MRLFELELKVASVEEGERLALADEGAGVDEPDLETAADAKSEFALGARLDDAGQRLRSLARLIVNRSDQHRARRRLLSSLFGRVTGGEGAGEQAGNQDDSALHGVRLPRLVGRGRGG